MVSEEEIKKLVIARLSAMPKNIKVSIGAYGSFDKYELIERVKKGDEIGKKIMEIQMFYLKSIKRGIK